MAIEEYLGGGGLNHHPYCANDTQKFWKNGRQSISNQVHICDNKQEKYAS